MAIDQGGTMAIRLSAQLALIRIHAIIVVQVSRWVFTIRSPSWENIELEPMEASGSPGTHFQAGRAFTRWKELRVLEGQQKGHIGQMLAITGAHPPGAARDLSPPRDPPFDRVGEPPPKVNTYPAWVSHYSRSVDECGWLSTEVVHATPEFNSNHASEDLQYNNLTRLKLIKTICLFKESTFD